MKKKKMSYIETDLFQKSFSKEISSIKTLQIDLPGRTSSVEMIFQNFLLKICNSAKIRTIYYLLAGFSTITIILIQSMDETKKNYQTR